MKKESKKSIKKKEAAKQKELETRLRIKQTLSKMKTQSRKLDDFKKNYIENAKKASLQGNDETYRMCKTGLKICLSKQKCLDQMIANFELSLQVSDMNTIVGEFFEGINLLSEQMHVVTGGVDMSKAQAAYEKALANNESQYEALESFLSTASDSIENLNGGEVAVTDEEIDKLISVQAADEFESSNMEKEMDLKFQNLREKLGD